MALARHVTYVHQNEGLVAKKSQTQPQTISEVTDDDETNSLRGDEIDEDDNIEAEINKKTLSPMIVREYISRARKFKPVVPPTVQPYIVEAYVGLRMQQHSGGNYRNRNKHGGDQTAMTARQLLSILRLSQALARLRFSDFVAREDVDEAIRLTHMSKASLTDDDYHEAGTNGANNVTGEAGRKRRKTEDITSRIFHILKEYATVSRSQRLEMKLCEAMVLRKGFTRQQMDTCIEEYQALDVLQLNSAGTHIAFL